MSYPFASSSSSSPSRCSTPATLSLPGTPSMPASPAMSFHSRESTAETMDLMIPSNSPHMGRRSRHGAGFWTSLMHPHGKSVQREEPEDEMMHIDSPADAFSFTSPPLRPVCTLRAAYQCSETSSLIPPSFYPGQSIPVVLTFELDRFSSLPHELKPTLTMSLIGTLHLPHSAPRTIICVSVSLSEGLALWARDAQQTYAHNPPRPSECSIDPSYGLPGGTYSLPLTVQVPSTPRLPPSFTVRSSTFAVTYALAVTLTSDDPALPGAGARVVLAETAKPFEMLPETLPTRAPKYVTQSFYVKTDFLPMPFPIIDDSTRTMAPQPILPLIRHRQNTRWSIHPYIPTTAYSPTSAIPFTLTLTPPSLADFDLNLEGIHPSFGSPITHPTFQILIRLALVRREHSSLSPAETRDAAGHGLVHEEEIVSRWGWIESSSEDKITLKDIALPLMPLGVSTWRHGMSTMLNVGPAASANGGEEAISVSSTFHMNVTLAFLSITPGSPVLSDYLPAAFSSASPVHIPPPGVFTQPMASSSRHHAHTHSGSAGYLNMARLKRSFPGTIKTLPLPIVVGSVSEPRGAMHNTRWSDLHLERNAGGREVGRMIHGEGVSCENGWIMPPPSYEEALQAAPYEYEV
ncbi:hypothetical protein I316_04508 [Kwoniella heveanensis BCC8398]|uniref:Uncharacterized protein n=1 Tax=Kwoniella heveanensis BCC8398 TaxID=1296120 RepID=A0A1B9GRZ4_9TREE|nr:hypothetical protein I316_04508 [Kwoniella heveanensis BCC8398]